MKRLKETGASLVEYALLLALICVVCIGAVLLAGNASITKLSTAGSGVEGNSALTPVGNPVASTTSTTSTTVGN